LQHITQTSARAVRWQQQLVLDESAPTVQAVPVGNAIQRIEERLEMDDPVPCLDGVAAIVDRVERPDCVPVEQCGRRIDRNA
jgi:hypothetical protein